MTNVDMNMIFTSIQMAFDYAMCNGELNPKETDQPKEWPDEWINKGFYMLLQAEQDTTLAGQYRSGNDNMVDYRISVERKESEEDWAPVHVTVASDAGFFSADFTNQEFGTITNYLKKKHEDGKLCFPNDLPNM